MKLIANDVNDIDQEDEKYGPYLESEADTKSMESNDWSKWWQSSYETAKNKVKEKPQLVGVGAGVVTVGCFAGVAPIAMAKVATFGMLATAATSIYSSINNSKGTEKNKVKSLQRISMLLFSKYPSYTYTERRSDTNCIRNVSIFSR